MELIRHFPPQAFLDALDSWTWLPGGLADKTPICASALGDVFLQGADGIWFLDTVEGTLARNWTDLHELEADLNTDQAQRDLLMIELVAAAHEAQLIPSQTEIVTFAVPPVLGGPLTVDNLELADFVVTINLAGQIHEQVKDLPPGTAISSVELG